MGGDWCKFHPISSIWCPLNRAPFPYKIWRGQYGQRFFVMRICNRSCQTALAYPVQQFKLISGSLKNFITTCSVWKATANKKIIRIRWVRIKIFYFLLLPHLYQFLHKRNADNTCLSITIVKYCLRKAACSAGKNDTLWCWLMTSGIKHSRYQESLSTSQQVKTTLAKFTKIEHHLRVFYQADQCHRPYSLCYPLEHKTLWYRAYFEAGLDLFTKALLCSDYLCMQVIFGWN